MCEVRDLCYRCIVVYKNLIIIIAFSIQLFPPATIQSRMKLARAYRTRPRKTHQWTKPELDKLCYMWIDMSPMTFHYTPGKICDQFVYWLKTQPQQPKTKTKNLPTRNAIMTKLYHCSKNGLTDTSYISVLHKTSFAEMQCCRNERYRILCERERQYRKEESDQYPLEHRELELDSDDDW